MGMRGRGRLRRSGAAERRQGTWEDWSGDATAAPHCSGWGASSHCSPSQQTPGGWRSPLTVACRESSIDKANVSIKQRIHTFTYLIVEWFLLKWITLKQNPNCCVYYMSCESMSSTYATGDDWMFLTWTTLDSFQHEPSNLHSAAAEPGPSLRGTRSYEPAQK